MSADKFKRLQPVEEAEERKDFDSGRFELQEKQRFDEAGDLPLRKRSLIDRAGQVEELQLDMPADELRVQSLDAHDRPPREASRTRGVLAGRAAGAAGGPSETSRRLKGAQPAAPRPASAASGSGGDGSDSGPRRAIGSRPGSARCTGAAQPMPAAAAIPPAAAELEPSQAAPWRSLPNPRRKKRMPSQLRLGKEGRAGGRRRPGIQRKWRRMPPLRPAVPPAEWAEAGYAFGGGAAASGSRDSNVDPEQKAAEKPPVCRPVRCRRLGLHQRIPPRPPRVSLRRAVVAEPSSFGAAVEQQFSPVRSTRPGRIRRRRAVGADGNRVLGTAPADRCPRPSDTPVPPARHRHDVSRAGRRPRPRPNRLVPRPHRGQAGNGVWGEVSVA